MDNSDVVILGMGYIGLPTAALIAKQGISVLGVDINQNVVDSINRGEVHIKEPGLEDEISSAVGRGKLRASVKASIGDVFIIVVPTPFKDRNEPDISFVENASKSVLPHLKEGDLFIIDSTSPVGTTEHIKDFIFQNRPDLEGKIFIAYAPERVLPGNAMHELIHNDRVVGGIDSASTEKAKQFYEKFVEGEIHTTNAKTAEMCKLVENSSRDVQIAFANELSIICDKAGINVWELISLANKHPRVNILSPGSGVGGHCIAVDPYFIVSKYPFESKIIGTAREVNNYKSFWCVEKVINAKLKFQIEHGRKAKIAIMGLAFKPNIDDLRESPAKYIAQKIMQDSGNETHFIVEPNLSEHSVFKLTDYNLAIKNADIVVFLVAHDEFKGLQIADDKIILDFAGVHVR